MKDGAKETLKMKVVDVAEGSDETSAVQNVNLPNRNVEWLQAKGSWIIHIGVIVFGKVLFSIIPGITPETSWTLTNLFYNMASFIIFHWLIGTPFADCSQTGHEVYSLTLWEQIDLGEQFTPTRKFLTAIPVVLFLLSTHYSNFDAVSFSVNFFSVLINLLAKMPVMDRVRLFGINKGK